jgi:probable HAF family extracellular repeat protein
MSRIRFGVWAAMALILVPLAGAQSYTITDLGALPGDSLSIPNGMNNQGAVVGFSEPQGSNNRHAFLWTQTGGMQDLGTLAGDSTSIAYGINDSGEVVGASSSTDASHAFTWTASGGMQELVSSSGDSWALAINDSGEVVGEFSPNGELDRHAFLWTEADGVRDLGSLGGSSSANAINAVGEVVGYSYTTPNELTVHGFRWTETGGMQDLGVLSGGADSLAFAVNESGEIFGVSNTSKRGDDEAAFWTESGGWHSLELGSDSSINAVNGSGELVGCSLYCARALLWTSENHGQLLDNLIPPNSGWLLYEGYAINQSGQIAAYGTINGAAHAALLTPTN